MESSYDAWGAPFQLSYEQYITREKHLNSLPFAKSRVVWVLVPSSHTSDTITISDVLSSCETYARDASIFSSSKVQDGKIFTITSVFTPVLHRKKGYSGILLNLLTRKLKELYPDALGTNLYSDVGSQFYKKIGWTPFSCLTSSIDVDTYFESNQLVKFQDDLIYLNQDAVKCTIQEDVWRLKELFFDSMLPELFIGSALHTGSLNEKSSHGESVVEDSEKSDSQSDISLDIPNNTDNSDNFTNADFGSVSPSVASSGSTLCNGNKLVIYPSYDSIEWLIMLCKHFHVETKTQSRFPDCFGAKNGHGYVIWVPDYREKCIQILRLHVSREEERERLLYLAVKAARECEFSEVRGWGILGNWEWIHKYERSYELPALDCWVEKTESIDWILNEKGIWI